MCTCKSFFVLFIYIKGLLVRQSNACSSDQGGSTETTSAIVSIGSSVTLSNLAQLKNGTTSSRFAMPELATLTNNVIF